MTKLTWGASGERYYETGVDRGVLFIDTVGIAWSGLVSVKESPSGGTPTPYYIDGFKYLQLSSAEEFNATIEAYSSPYQFDVCDGSSVMNNGLYVTQQPRKQFGLSYRTKIGNDTDGPDHGYKIHIVYNALAAPSQQGNVTLSDTPSPIVFSWPVTTAPERFEGFRPTAHFVVDSRYTTPGTLAQIEAILYGTAFSEPRLITTDELLVMFSLAIVDLGAGRYSATGTAVKEPIPGFLFSIDHDAISLLPEEAGVGHFLIEY